MGTNSGQVTPDESVMDELRRLVEESNQTDKRLSVLCQELERVLDDCDRRAETFLLIVRSNRNRYEPVIEQWYQRQSQMTAGLRKLVSSMQQGFVDTSIVRKHLIDAIERARMLQQGQGCLVFIIALMFLWILWLMYGP